MLAPTLKRWGYADRPKRDGDPARLATRGPLFPLGEKQK